MTNCLVKKKKKSGAAEWKKTALSDVSPIKHVVMEALQLLPQCVINLLFVPVLLQQQEPGSQEPGGSCA